MKRKPPNVRNRAIRPGRTAGEIVHAVDRWSAFHQILNTATPLAGDCGSLCDAKCCQGGPEDGMLLYPGEESMYPNLPEGWVLKDTELYLPALEKPVKLLVCTGHCERPLRPASCRIFPLLPWIDGRGRIRVKADLRAYRICPLLFDTASPSMRHAFSDAICRAFEYVLPLPGVRDMIDRLNEENRVIGRFMGISDS